MLSERTGQLNKDKNLQRTTIKVSDMFLKENQGYKEKYLPSLLQKELR